MKPHLSETLTNRTFLGLLLAQFTASFNDQAIHIVAVFYSVDMLVRYVDIAWIDDKKVIAIVTSCFLAPFLLFSSYAGPLGDRFSKRSVIVFWKVAEVVMMAMAFVGLSLTSWAGPDSPHLKTLAVVSSVLVILTVFLMGLHSTFFVPAKLGVMPEILHPAILSRANGVLEGTSFTAQILGTSAGGILYSLLKGEDTATGTIEPGRGDEWLIGALLLGLAILGTATAFLMRPIPAAAPDSRVSWNWWKPLQENLGILWRSKPLTLSVTGIAFNVVLALFLRQTLLYQGELSKELRTARIAQARLEGRPIEEAHTSLDRFLSKVLPPRLDKAAQEPELRTSLLFAVVGLGVGLGSLLAGYLSGHRIELGLVPVGALSIVLFTLFLSLIRRVPGVFVTSLFGIGAGAGFYLVPLYTLLQHRAPKESKGNVVAASNFLNVGGGIVSVAIFYLLSFIFDKLWGATITDKALHGSPSQLTEYVAQLTAQMTIPRALFLSAGVLMCLAIVLLRLRLHDFFLRAAIWIQAGGHNSLRTFGIEHMPIDGPVVLLTNCNVFRAALDLIAAVDRAPRVVLVEEPRRQGSWLRNLAQRSELVTVPAMPGAAEWQNALAVGIETLRDQEMVALTVNQPTCAADVTRLIKAWRAAAPEAVVLPVFCTAAADAPQVPAGPLAYPRVVFGRPIAPQATLAETLAAIEALASSTDEL